MRVLPSGWPWALLLAAAVGLGVAASTGQPGDFPVPSVSNPGPKGAQVVHTWLTESGSQVAPLASLTAIPAGLEVVVIAAPTQQPVTAQEVAALERFARAGGQLVYLAPRPARLQPELMRWLELKDVSSRLPEVNQALLGDVGGASVAVDSQHPALAGVRQLRVSAESAIEVQTPGAVAVAGNWLWTLPLGKGEVWIGAGPDLIENRRLDLLDNAQLWANLGSKQLAFDELHHAAPVATGWSANLWATLLQFIFAALLFVAVRAPRLGPPRPALARQHRSSLEYVASMGALMRRAKVEPELKLQLRARLRRLMQERLGIPIALGAEEASRLLGGHTGLPLDTWLRLDAQLCAADGDFTKAAAEAARVEDAVIGRRSNAGPNRDLGAFPVR